MAIGQDGQNSETSFGGRSPATSPHSPSLSSFSKTGTHRGSLKKILDKSVSHRFFFFLFSIYFNLIKFLQIEKKVEKDEFGGAGGRSERFRIAIASGGRFPSRWSSALYGRPATRLEKRISVARSSIGKHRFHQIHSRVKKIDFLKILFPFFFNSIFKKISGALDRICRLVSGPAMTWQLGFTTWASICTSANGNAGT